MQRTAQKQILTDNRLLAALPSKDYESLFPHLSLVRLSSGLVLYEPFHHFDYCYFINDSLVSCMSITEQGASVAVAMVGCEGLLGAAALLDKDLLPYRAVTLCPGSAMKIHPETLKAWLHNSLRLRELILSYAHAMFTQVIQTAACNRFHTTEQRLIRWLLLARDRLGTDTLTFTQESLSHMVGTDRVSITRAVQRLKKIGLIDYSRGKITIFNRIELKSACCECYSIIESVYADLLNP